MSYENFDPNDLLIQAYSAKPEGNFGPHRIPNGIRVIHLPTGTIVSCHEDRSQHKNRHTALTRLWEQVQGKPSYAEMAAQNEALRQALANLIQNAEIALEEDFLGHASLKAATIQAEQVLSAVPAYFTSMKNPAVFEDGRPAQKAFWEGFERGSISKNKNIRWHWEEWKAFKLGVQ